MVRLAVADGLPQPRERLAQAVLGRLLGLIGPQQPGQLFAAHRLGGFQRQVGQQSAQLVISEGYRLAFEQDGKRSEQGDG